MLSNSHPVGIYTPLSIGTSELRRQVRVLYRFPALWHFSWWSTEDSSPSRRWQTYLPTSDMVNVLYNVTPARGEHRVTLVVIQGCRAPYS